MAEPYTMNFCPVCGQPLTDAHRFGKNRRTCLACGFVHFADPKVAVVVFIVSEGRVLMVKRAVDPQKGRWALPAGYVDYGEDPRDAAVREVKEETGLDVTLTRLVDVLGPEKDRTGPASIAIIFEAAVSGGVLAAHDDVSKAVFFAPPDLPYGEVAFESTRLMLSRWLASI